MSDECLSKTAPASDAENVIKNEANVSLNTDYDLSKFQLDSILNNSTNRKTVACLGRFVDRSETDRAIIVFEKKAFAEADLRGSGEEAANDENGGAAVVVDGYFSSASQLKKQFTNDIYGNFECCPNPEINSVKATIIYPATENHIKKHSAQEIFIFNETPEDYKNKTLPYLESEQFSLDWVYNILEHRKETERIVFEDTCPDTGFVLLPDLKWDGKTFETLYLLAIVQRRNIKSLRDLTASDLPLLYNIRSKGIAAIKDKYGVPGTQLRMYFHYQPSFYHLHVHFTHLQHEAPGIRCERGHLLDIVITNLELLGDYYQRATLPFVVSKQFKLYAVYAKDRKRKNSEDAELTGRPQIPKLLAKDE